MVWSYRMFYRVGLFVIAFNIRVCFFPKAQGHRDPPISAWEVSINSKETSFRIQNPAVHPFKNKIKSQLYNIYDNTQRPSNIN